MQIKTTMRYHLTPARMAKIKNIKVVSVGRDRVKRELSYTVGGNVNWFSHCGKQYGGSSKIYIELPFDPAIPLLGIYPKDKRILNQKSVCTSMFIAALFTIAKTWSQPKCPQTDEWIEKVWHIYSMEFYSAIKNKTLAFYRK